MYKFLFLLGASLATCTSTSSAPAPESTELPLGITFQGKSTSLPILTLPYASYRATKYDYHTDVYIFENIRFAAPPVGKLRWHKPVPPEKEPGIQNGTYGPRCVQSPVRPQIVDATDPLSKALSPTIERGYAAVYKGGAEDCLFLNLYVPRKALKNTSMKLPVIVWIFGGAYIFGSKDDFGPVRVYDGTGVIASAKRNAIFVAGNYRLGAYGFMAGKTMEREAVPNTGFHDQRAVFQWVRQYIHLVGGNKKQVSAWGQSAGAGSLMHHLIAEGGKLDPLFHRAILESPASLFLWDRHTRLEANYKKFEAAAGCAGLGVACLRAATPFALERANNITNSNMLPGVFVYGPAVDGKYIRQLPGLELEDGNYWPKLDSIIVSHTRDEAKNFIPVGIKTDADFENYLRRSYPASTEKYGLIKEIMDFYPGLDEGRNLFPDRNFSRESDRVNMYMRDPGFTCPTRFLAKAYAGKAYAVQYSNASGTHGSDLMPTFYKGSITAGKMRVPMRVPAHAAYQSYLTSHARTGNPNTYRLRSGAPVPIEWPLAEVDDEEKVRQVLEVGKDAFRIIEDETNLKSHCDFWLKFWRRVQVIDA